MKDDARETLIGNQKLQALIRVRKGAGFQSEPVLLERDGQPTERFKFVPDAMKAAEGA